MSEVTRNIPRSRISRLVRTVLVAGAVSLVVGASGFFVGLTIGRALL